MNRARSRSWGRWLAAILLAAGGVAGWRWYAGRNGPEPLDYRTAPVTRGDITQLITANGQLSPVQSVTVGSQVSGIITKILADFNSQVTNGQVLAQIDPSAIRQSLTQAEAELASVRASLELAALNHRRAQELVASQLIAQSEYDQSLVTLHQAEAAVRMREAAVEKVRVDLERTTIYSPIDGVVISRAVDMGQTVAASFNTPTLFLIANDLRKMRIEAAVSEADVGGVTEGQRVTFTVDAYLGRQFAGQVSQVRFAPVTNQNVVNYIAIVDVNNDDLKLRPGMTANASIITGERRDVLRLPSAALRFRLPENALVLGGTSAPPAAASLANEGRGPGAGRGERPMGLGNPAGAAEKPAMRTIYLVDTNAAGVGLRPVSVRLGISDSQSIEAIEGVKEGDRVAIGLNQTEARSGTAAGSSPFGGPFGRPPR